MNISEYDAWRNSRVGIWFFEEWLPEQSRNLAEHNGRSVGAEPTLEQDYMSLAKRSGLVEGIDAVADADPFIDEREEKDAD